MSLASVFNSEGIENFPLRIVSYTAKLPTFAKGDLPTSIS